MKTIKSSLLGICLDIGDALPNEALDKGYQIKIF